MFCYIFFLKVPICSLCSVAQVQFVCVFKTNTKFPDRGEMSFPLFKLYACNNVTKYVLFLFDLAKCIFYGTVLLYILFIKRRQNLIGIFVLLRLQPVLLKTCEKYTHCIAKLLEKVTRMMTHCLVKGIAMIYSHA